MSNKIKSIVKLTSADTDNKVKLVINSVINLIRIKHLQ